MKAIENEFETSKLNKRLNEQEIIHELEQQIERSNQNMIDLLDLRKEVNTISETLKNHNTVEALNTKYNHCIEEIANNEKNINLIKLKKEEEQHQLLYKIAEQQKSLTNFFETIEEKFKCFEKIQKDQVKKKNTNNTCPHKILFVDKQH